jgi:hypothetical protein
MAETAASSIAGLAPPSTLVQEKIKKSPGRLGKLIFGLVLKGGLGLRPLCIRL